MVNLILTCFNYASFSPMFLYPRFQKRLAIIRSMVLLLNRWNKFVLWFKHYAEPETMFWIVDLPCEVLNNWRDSIEVKSIWDFDTVIVFLWRGCCQYLFFFFFAWIWWGMQKQSYQFAYVGYWFIIAKLLANFLVLLRKYIFLLISSSPSKLCFLHAIAKRGSWRGKMGIGIGRFCPWENGVQTTLGLGFGRWEWENNVKNQKWDSDLRIAKWDLERKWTGK